MSDIRTVEPFLSRDASVDAFPIPSGHLIIAGRDDADGRGVAVRITPDTARALAAWLLAATAE